MKSTARRRSTKKAQKLKMVPATPAQIVRQTIVALVVVAIWAGLLVVYLNLTGKDEAPVSESPQPTEVVAAPEATQVPTPTEQPPMATHTVAVATETAEGTSGPTAFPTETPAATSSPTVLPVETDTPPSPSDTTTPPGAAGVSFSEDVLPILTSRCQRCHGGDRIEAGLDLLSYAGVMAGSENGPVVIPGNSTTSSLVQVIVSGQMPKRAPRLPDSEIETIGNWVDQGALDN